MRILLALLLFATFSASAASIPASAPTLLQWSNAEVWVKDGSLYTIVEVDKLTGGTEKWCKAIPLTFINSLPATRQKLILIELPSATQEVTDNECKGLSAPSLWKVAVNPSSTSVPPTRPLKNAAFVDIGRVEVGTPCELAMVKTSVNGAEYHCTTNKSGLRGIALCTK
jgi:hypothetical protein